MPQKKTQTYLSSSITIAILILIAFANHSSSQKNKIFYPGWQDELSTDQEHGIVYATFNKVLKGSSLTNDFKPRMFYLDQDTDINKSPLDALLAGTPGYNGPSAIRVRKTIFTIIENEDQLACVIAHEIKHLEYRHSQEFGEFLLPLYQEWTGNTDLKIYEINPDDESWKEFKEEFQNQINDYSRELEDEADAGAVDLIAIAGFDPKGCPQAFKNLAAYIEDLDLSPNADHSPMIERVNAVQDISNEWDQVGFEP